GARRGCHQGRDRRLPRQARGQIIGVVMSANPPIPVFLSGDATSKVRELILEEGNPNLMLRISVSGGGCSGFQYGFAFEQQSEEADLVFEKEGVRVLIDPISLQYLRG